MDDRRLDPDAPLPGPPEPWAETDMPSPRDGPPWHMTEMIEAEPALAVRILDRLATDGSAERLAALVREFADAGQPIIAVGCGTSDHAAEAVAEILAESIGARGGWVGAGAPARPTAVQAFEAMADAGFAKHRSLVIGVSHEGASWATMGALDRAAMGDAATAVITVSDRTPAAQMVDVVLATAELDRSWCHTIGYLAPIVAAIAVTHAMSSAANGPEVPRLAAEEVRELLAGGLARDAVAQAEAVARELAGCRQIVVIGTGRDRIAARELALKIEEGTHIPSPMRDVETLLHGHLAGMDDETGLVAIGSDTSGYRPRRVAQALRAAREIGIRSAGIFTEGFAEEIPSGEDLTPAGRIVVPPAGATTVAAGLVATTIPLQLLTERIARLRGVNPDPIRRDDSRYLRAAEASSPQATDTGEGSQTA